MGEVRDYDYGYVSLDEVEEVVRDAPREADNIYFFFSSRRRHTRFDCDWSSERVLFRSAADLALRLLLDRLHHALALVLVDVRHDVEREVQDALQVARRHVEQDAETARRPLEEPDMRHRRRELDVAHALAADLRARHLDAALVADDPLVADPLVLAAVALPVTRRAEDALVEEPVLLRPQRAVVDRLGLRDLAARPRADLVR